MLGFWIIIAHLVGAYLTSSEYIQMRTHRSTAFAFGSAILYMIPFILFLPSSALSFVAVLAFRFLVIRFDLIDYLIWVRNTAAPRDQRVDRLDRREIDVDGGGSISHLVSIHIGSIAVHCIISALAIIVL